jgi:hypothetical protein
LTDERERRIGENEALFRSVNEKVEELGESFSTITDTFLIVCECGTQSCMEHIELQPAEYERVRRNPLHFLIKPGHEFNEVEEVIEQTDRYWVVEKDSGVPAAIAQETDPRS